jgi:succinate dehydrogenase / fumarate reductase cytochrome b subunit
MNWFFRFIFSSIGKKGIMALTGLFFCLFIFIHLMGNLMIYGGKEGFVAYSERLHSLGIFINIVEILLLLSGIIHLSFALLLYIENLKARPTSYYMKRYSGGRTLSSATMPYTGLILLVFVVIHLIDFHFADKGTRTIYDIMTNALQNPLYSAFYIFSAIVLALHVRHGFWSAFQSLGMNHPKYMPLIRGMAILFAIVAGAGFSSVPIYIFLKA